MTEYTPRENSFSDALSIRQGDEDLVQAPMVRTRTTQHFPLATYWVWFAVRTCLNCLVLEP